MKRADILVAGVGGQGTLLASNILAEVGMRAGFDVKKSDVLGLAVRGGSVFSHVRWGCEAIASPVVPQGQMGYLLAFEPLEAVRGIHLMHPTSHILCNSQPVIPISVSSGDGVYPPLQSMKEWLGRSASTVRFIDATRMAMDLGNPKATNVIMLGAFSTLFDIDAQVWLNVVLAGVPERHVALNARAFEAGCKALKGETA